MGNSMNPDARRVVDSTKVWTTLITNTAYLSGLLTLDFALKQHDSRYPLIALYTDSFPEEGHKALDIRNIPKKHVKYLVPSAQKDFSKDPRFYDCWSKLTPFSLTEYERVVQLDSDMLVMGNMDELMDVKLDPPEMRGEGDRVFAACHACVCNPMGRPHYPSDWVPENCAYTVEHQTPDKAQVYGASSSTRLGIPNGGLQVVNPSRTVYDKIVAHMSLPSTMQYDFADQSLLSDLFKGRWVGLPYIYNALKTLRDVHRPIWREERVKNIHYILSPKPFEEEETDKTMPETHRWWWQVNNERLRMETKVGIDDGF